MDRFTRFLYSCFSRLWEPLFFVRRRKYRLGHAGHQDANSLTELTIGLGQSGVCGCANCISLIRRYDAAYRYLRPGPGGLRYGTSSSKSRQATLHAIALPQNFHYVEYKNAMRRKSANFMRDAARSKRSGYVVSDIHHGNYTLDILAIHRSSKVRSFGLYLDAFILRLGHLGGSPRQYAPLSSPQCFHHWEKLIGVLIPRPGYRQGAVQTDQQLVGYARLARIGNTVAYRDFIGHAEHVKNGVMKQLHLHVVEWLLERSDPLVQGVEQLTYGAVERGGDGLYFWKKKALFKPYLVCVEPQRLPADFSVAEYLRLNPDLKGLRIDLDAHYIWHGRAEKRFYKADVPPDFDPVQYLALNPDLQCGACEADVHYTLHGRHENRPYRDANASTHTVVGHMSYG